MQCHGCQSENQTGAVFCSACGRRFSTEPGPTPVAERRQLTVMFCDVVGSTSLSQQLDPEDLRDLLRSYQAACAAVIQRFGGHLAQYLGDGVLAYFGYPVAHGDDGERAVHAGLGIVEAIRTLNARLEPRHGVRLEVRIGIHTGVVVAGEMGTSDRLEQLAVGETPNIAARVQGLASPDCVVVSEATLRLVAGRFTVQAGGAHAVKGVREPVRIYRVLEPAAARNRLEGAGRLSPFVGRDTELAELREAYESVRRGSRRCVLITGEPGIGKSRLLHALHDRLGADPPHWMTCQCSAYFADSPLHPVVAWLRSDLGIRAGAPVHEQLRELDAALVALGVVNDEAVLIARLVSLAGGEESSDPTWTPQRRKRETLATLTRIVAARAPAVLVVEDVHWADPSTLEWLDQLISSAGSVPYLVVMTARPSFRSPWPASAGIVPLALERLDAGHVASIVASVTGGKRLPLDVAEQIMGRTDGVPLFVEELTKMLLESNLLEERDDHWAPVGPMPLLAIPTTLQDSLMARLDRLGATKRVAQLGSVFGREFSLEMLVAVANEPRETILEHLAALTDARLLLPTGRAGEERYGFHHALIRDAAYQSLLRAQRREYHQRAARALEERFPDTVETAPELVAHHYAEACLAEPAIAYWLKAGRRAIGQSANREAIEHLGKGLALVTELPDDGTRIRRELELQTALGPALNVTRGYGAPDVERTYTRAHELCRQVGDASQTFWAVWGLWAFHLVRGEIENATDLVQQLLALAAEQADPAIVLEAHGAAGQTFFFRGDLPAARAHLETGIALDRPDRDRSNTLITGGDVGTGARSNAALVLWHLGFPDRARELSAAAIELARRYEHPYSLAFALTFAARLSQSLRDGAATRRLAEEVIALSEVQGFFWVTQGMFFRGCALVEENPSDAIAQIRAGLEAYRLPGAALSLTYMLAQLADTHRIAGDYEAAGRVLGEAFAVMEKTGERFWEPELRRLQGELLATSDKTAARRCLGAALEAARRQQAKSLELRSATSLARLEIADHGRRAAHDVLAEVCAWFGDAADTADLRDARALLADSE